MAEKAAVGGLPSLAVCICFYGFKQLPLVAPRWAQGTRKVASPSRYPDSVKFAGDTTVVALRRKAKFTKSGKPYHVQSQFISKLTVPF